MAEKRTEVSEETSERLELLELDRTPRAEKLAREAALLEGASEVHYHERAFRPRHGAAPIEEIRARIDALPDQRAARSLPDIPAVPAAPSPPPRAVKPEHRKLLEPVIDGALVRVDSLYTTATAEVVEAAIQKDGVERRETWLLEENAARPMDDIDATVDDLPPPAPPKPVDAVPTAPTPPRDEKKSRFKLSKPKLPFGKKKAD